MTSWSRVRAPPTHTQPRSLYGRSLYSCASQPSGAIEIAPAATAASAAPERDGGAQTRRVISSAKGTAEGAWWVTSFQEERRRSRPTLACEADDRLAAAAHVHLAAHHLPKRAERRTQRRLVNMTWQAAEPDDPVVLRGARRDLLVLQHGRADRGGV